MKRLELVYCEMEPGTALFFHANLLHASSRNVSERPRWSLICCYSSARNDPYKDSHHASYTRLLKVEDGEILKVAMEGRSTRREYLDPAQDKTVVGNKTSVS
jgi:ectoine hydroxylase-related dioxygenase (phytanoyl-CoA dioxygenase family)